MQLDTSTGQKKMSNLDKLEPEDGVFVGEADEKELSTKLDLHSLAHSLLRLKVPFSMSDGWLRLGEKLSIKKKVKKKA